jgi:hypothetical protein
MLNFSDIYQQLMLIVNRPISETSVLTGAKWEINQAVKYLQRDHAYAYTERLCQFVYQPGTLLYDLGNICGGSLRDLLSAQTLNQTGKPYGRPTKIITYNQLQQMRMHFSRTHALCPGDWYAPANLDLYDITIEDTFRHDRIIFISGQNVGLYPMPSEPETILLNCHIWLPALIKDTDTNFFLEYASDVVMMCALKKMHLYMKSDQRFQFTSAEFMESLSTLKAWDAQVRETPNTNLAGHTGL